MWESLGPINRDKDSVHRIIYDSIIIIAIYNMSFNIQNLRLFMKKSMKFLLMKILNIFAFYLKFPFKLKIFFENVSAQIKLHN